MGGIVTRLVQLDRLLALVQRAGRMHLVAPESVVAEEAAIMLVKTQINPARYAATGVHAGDDARWGGCGDTEAAALADLERVIKAVILNGGDERGVVL